ncbi:MAG TPA: hypothetical protein VLA68_02545 [Nitrososphaera sp.]|nr:hypothetical protein [Nitrososphaera sp.]
MQREKPPGIDLLAIVLVIEGIFSFFAGIDMLFFASFLASTVPISPLPADVAASVADYYAIWGSTILVIGLVSFLLAYGLFNGRSWAWSGTVALSIVGIILPIANIIAGYWPAVFTLILCGIILYYLYRPEVRAYLSRAAFTSSDSAAA